MFGKQGNLIALVSAFLPPKGRINRRKFAEEVKQFFQGENKNQKFTPYSDFQIETALRRTATTAEAYLLLSCVKGAGSYMYHHMLEQLQADRRKVTDWYLLRYGAMRVVHPVERHVVTPHLPNRSSRDFFWRRGFDDLGRVTNELEVACRETREGTVVGVEPIWAVMHAEREESVRRSGEEVQNIKAEAQRLRKVARKISLPPK
jgi:hypothetical protein